VSALIVSLVLLALFVPVSAAEATFATNTQISNGQGFLQGEFAEVGVRANGAFGSTSVPSGFHANPANCLGFRVDREMDGWGSTTDDGDYFCPGSPFEGWQVKVGSSLGLNDHYQTGVSGAVSDIQNSGSSQCVSWISASPYNGVSISQRYCVPTAGQALHTDVTLTNTTSDAISDVFFGRGFDPDNATGSGSMTCAGSEAGTNMFQSCNAVTGQGTEAQATARWGNNAFIALQSFDARARVARQTGGFSSPDPADIWNAGNTLATSGTYLGNVGEMYADAGIYVALNVPTLGAGASTSFRISYVLSADGNNAPVLGAPVVSGIGQTSATVASTVNPKGFSTTAELFYSTDPDFGTSSSVSMGTFTGTDEVAIDAEITGLDPSEIYYAKIVATNETGETESAVFEFDTLAADAPIVSSEEPTVSVDDGPVTLSGTLNPNGFSSTAVFQYSTTSDFSGTVVDIPVSGTFTGTSLSTVSTVVEGLTGSTTYYFRLKVTNASGSAYGSTISFVPADIVAPVGIVVTSLADDGSNGTLRWAINQANATAGGIYDAIVFSVDGTITLTSDLPAITEGVTITGTGMATTIIDGDNLYRSLNNNGTRTIAVSDMTFKRGKATNGGIGYTNNGGTFTFTRVKFTDMTSGSAWFQSNANVTTFIDSEFSALASGVKSDYGSTPSALSQTDSDYTNRIYIDGSTFTNNTYGVYTERFVKINNSQFTDNTYGAILRGLNRQQVINSVFTSNSVGVYFASWIPTTWTPGAGNQTVSGSTFNGNTTAIQFANNFNNGSTTYNGVSANSWSTSTGNTFGATTINTANYSGTGYVTEDDTITAAYFNAVANLTAVANSDGSVNLDWDEPTSSNTAIYGYSVSFYDLDEIGGTASGGWGVWTNQGTDYSLGEWMFSGSNPVTTGFGPVRFGIKAMSGQCVGVGSGSCTYGPEATVDATVLDPTPVTTTTSSTTTTTTVYVPPVDSGTTTTVYQPPVVVIPPVEETTTTTSTVPVAVVPTDDTTTTLPQYPDPEEGSTTTTLPTETEPEIELPTITVPKYEEEILREDEEENPWGDSTGTPEEFDELPADATPEEIGAVIEEVDFTEISDSDFDNTIDAVFDNIENPEDVADVIGSFLEADISDEQFDAVLDKVFDGPMTANETTEILEELLDGPVTITQLQTIMDKVFEDISDTKETVAVLTNLFNGPLSNEELDSVMEAVFSEDATVDQMSDVMTDLLGKNLDAKELDAMFEAAFDGDLTDKETIDLIVDVLAEDLTSEALGSALGAVFDEEVSNEVLVKTFTAVLGNELNEDSVEVIVNVLESESISEAQVATVVTLIIEQEGGVDAEQATELATSPKVLESISGEQATEVFDAIIVAEVSEEAGAEIAEALAEAPTDVKEAFEEEINVFAGVFDTYVALGSEINVGDRRTVIAVGAAVSLAGAAVALGGASPSSGGGAPSGGPGSPSGQNNNVARKPEEEEMNGELAWDGVEWIKQLSIFRYNNGVKILDWGLFVKKFIYGFLNLGFTISGSLIVYLTLSGTIQRIAGISSILAFVGAMYLHMREPDNN